MTKKLLVADDSVTIQRVVHLAFAGEDVQIEAVSDGGLALEAARRIQPDIIFADVFMPGLNGYELCAQVKNEPGLKGTPVVLMVGAFESYDSEEASRAGSSGCLTKPFDTNELLQIFGSLVKEPPAPAEPAVAAATEIEAPTLREPAPAAMALALEPPLGERTRSSFLGPDRILDLFASVTATAASGHGTSGVSASSIPREIVRTIIDSVVRQISPDIIREVAWEVIPELSEMIIREKMGSGRDDYSLEK
jgi:CheY-like chemotaxis protein